jgi:hypothetical protein
MPGTDRKHVVRLSPAGARLVGGNAVRDEQRSAAAGNLPFESPERLAILCLLVVNPDAEIRQAARETLRSTGKEELAAFVADPELHPRFLELVARLCCGDRSLLESIVSHPAASAATVAFLIPHLVPVGHKPEHTTGVESQQLADDAPAKGGGTSRAVYLKAQELGIGEKIKMALTGDKEWRTVLIRDTVKPVCCAVIKNPRITEAEILAISRSTVQYDDIIRLICANREWLKKYPIRKALAENNKTPLTMALRLMATLGEKDLAALSKSKNVSTVIVSQARKLLLTKKDR